MSDLSDYEKIRLANIQRNAEFLKSIGLGSVQAAVQKQEVVKVRKLKEPSRRSNEQEPVDTSNRRKSRRLSNETATDSLPDNWNDKVSIVLVYILY